MMEPANEKDLLGDFMESETFHRMKAYRSELEKVTLSLYIFSALSLLLFVFYLLLNAGSFDWFVFVLNILLIAIYFCLAWYSSFKPFTAIIATVCVLFFVVLLQIFFNPQLNLKAVVLNVSLALFLLSKWEAAKQVQASKSKTSLYVHEEESISASKKYLPGNRHCVGLL